MGTGQGRVVPFKGRSTSWLGSIMVVAVAVVVAVVNRGNAVDVKVCSSAAVSLSNYHWIALKGELFTGKWGWRQRQGN